MKKIFGLIALTLLVAVAMTSCDNKPPFVKLANAIDSLNIEYKRINNTDDDYVTYDKYDNVVHFNISYPERIESDAFEAKAEFFKQRFLTEFVTADQFGIASEVIDAKANVEVDLKGLDNTKYEILIVTNEIIEAYNAAHSSKDNGDGDNSGNGDSDDNPDQMPEEGVEQLEHGNITTID